MGKTVGMAYTPPPNSFDDKLVVRSRFIPPRPKPQFIPRPQLDNLLTSLTDHPLTLLKAETGYRKTTAVASFLAESNLVHFWYSLGDENVDPLTFLLHIIHTFRSGYPQIGEQSLALLAQKGGAARLWAPAVDAFANDLLDTLSIETVLVLDDYSTIHHAEINAITDRLIEQMPPYLHLVITTRTMPSLPGRVRWHATGELFEIGRAELAFTPDEINTLFTQRTGQILSPSLAHALAAETEGWPVAVQLLSEGIGSTQSRILDDWLRRIPGPLKHLFDYLAEEVFLHQPAEIQTFLIETATLRRLEPQSCDALLNRTDSQKILHYLEENSLFVTGESTYRYHSLFQDFLRHRVGVPAERRCTLHGKAAEYYQKQGDFEEAVYHLLAAGDHTAAAGLLATIARPMAYNGRHQTLAAWLDQLPEDLLATQPELLLARGHAFRFTSRYSESLAAYDRAWQQFERYGDSGGEVRALRGQAQVYLDTVQPRLAEPILRQALRKVGRSAKQERANLLILLAENKLNAGQLPGAERLHHNVYCVAHRDNIPPINPRVYVRDGQFSRARQLVETNLRADPWGAGQWRVPRSHREATTLLAWIDAMTGEANNARHYAGQSLELGQALDSPIIECVSLSRLGHGWLTGTDYDPIQAREYYRESLAIAEHIGVPRFKVESHLGLILIAGLEGKVAEARAIAGEALMILEASGDRYMTGILNLVLGAALTLCNHPEAEDRLNEAVHIGQICGDRFSPCLANLWLAIHFSRLNRADDAFVSLNRALPGSQEHGYDFIFTGIPFLGPKDFTSRLRLLSQVSPTEPMGRYATYLRNAISPWTSQFNPYAFSMTNLETAPLYIQTLGPFRVRQAGREIEHKAWRRTKVLHLLQFLVCRRGHLVHREQILDALWPDTPPAMAATGLRVALNGLRKVLAPDPAKEETPDFICRKGDSLQLDLSPGVRVDADEFVRLVRSAQTLEEKNPERAIELYETGLALYRGDFLEGNPYAEWAYEERENLIATYLLAVERLAKLLIKRDEYERGMRWANTILAKEPLWEEGYALLMQCHWQRGNRAMAVRIYDRCRRRLRESLDIDPSPRTTALFQEISQT